MKDNVILYNNLVARTQILREDWPFYVQQPPSIPRKKPGQFFQQVLYIFYSFFFTTSNEI